MKKCIIILGLVYLVNPRHGLVEKCLFLLIAVYLIHLFYCAFRYIAGQITRRRCMKFAKKTLNGEVKLFFIHTGEVCGYDRFGYPIYKQGLVNENNEEVDFLANVRKELHAENITAFPNLPDRAYRAGIREVTLKRDKDGTPCFPPVVEIFLQPLIGYCDEWTVVDANFIWQPPSSENTYLKVILEHPIMGRLIFPKGTLKGTVVTKGKIFPLKTSGRVPYHWENRWTLYYKQP